MAATKAQGTQGTRETVSSVKQNEITEDTLVEALLLLHLPD